MAMETDDVYPRVESVPCTCGSGCNDCDWTGTILRTVGGRALPRRRDSKRDKIYIVMGTSGYGQDRIDVPLAAFRRRAPADLMVGEGVELGGLRPFCVEVIALYD